MSKEDLEKELEKVKEQARCGIISEKDIALLSELLNLSDSEKDILAKNYFTQEEPTEIKKEH